MKFTDYLNEATELRTKSGDYLVIHMSGYRNTGATLIKKADASKYFTVKVGWDEDDIPDILGMEDGDTYDNEPGILVIKF